MPKVLSYTPGWLSRPSPGFQIFADAPKTSPPAHVSSAHGADVPLRTIARRGTQIFVAVGNEIRWSDLVLLKDYESEAGGRGRIQTPMSMDSSPESLFRVRLEYLQLPAGQR
jgi:nucleoporin NUP82